MWESLRYCPAYQRGKATLSKTDKNDKTVEEFIVKHPYDLVHMDQAESLTPGRPVTFSGLNNKKIFIFTLFTINVFYEFQHSTGASDSADLKISMGRECM